jgi:hypothetical protein
MPFRTSTSSKGAFVRFGIRPITPPGGNQYEFVSLAAPQVPSTSLMNE